MTQEGTGDNERMQHTAEAWAGPAIWLRPPRTTANALHVSPLVSPSRHCGFDEGNHIRMAHCKIHREQEESPEKRRLQDGITGQLLMTH